MRRHEIIPEVARAVAEVKGCSPLELNYSLYDYVDTTALRSQWESERTDWELTFETPDHTVVVRGSGEILVDDAVVREATTPPFGQAE